jgi:hypothetical protein
MGRSGGIEKRKTVSQSASLSRATIANASLEEGALENVFNHDLDQAADQVVGFFERFNLSKKRRFKSRLSKIKYLSKGSISQQMEAESLIKDSIEELAQISPLLENPEAKAAIDNFLKPYKEAALITLANKTDQDLGLLTDSELIRLARWQEGIDRLLKEDTLNSANTYELLTEANGGGDWLKKRLADPKIMNPANDPAEKESIHLQIKIIEGVLAVEADPELKAIDDTIRNSEDEIRDQATLLGDRPNRSLIVLPTPELLGVPPRYSAPAHHCYSSGKDYGQTNKYIFIYSDSIISSSGDRENGTNYSQSDSISFARHELIHAGQVNVFGADRKYRQLAKEAGLSKARDQEEVAEQIKESLTEGLNITRGFESGQVFDQFGIQSTDCAYREEMLALSGVFDQIGLSKDKREDALELLNTLPAGEVVQILDSQLKNSGTKEGFITLFQRLRSN